jgi:hypothetical protein
MALVAETPSASDKKFGVQLYINGGSFTALSTSLGANSFASYEG